MKVADKIIGDIKNKYGIESDTKVEVTSGLKEGDIIYD
jgi:hypothetical protein